jgi:hypothetical protein
MAKVELNSTQMNTCISRLFFRRQNIVYWEIMWNSLYGYFDEGNNLQGNLKSSNFFFLYGYMDIKINIYGKICFLKGAWHNRIQYPYRQQDCPSNPLQKNQQKRNQYNEEKKLNR